MNVVAIVHEPPAGIVAQLFVWLNSEALVPVMLILLITRSDVPVFLIVMVFPDVPPSFTFPKFTDLGVTDILGVPASKGVTEKVKRISTSVAKNITNDFDFIRLSPHFFQNGNMLRRSSTFGISAIFYKAPRFPFPPHERVSFIRKTLFAKKIQHDPKSVRLLPTFDHIVHVWFKPGSITILTLSRKCSRSNFSSAVNLFAIFNSYLLKMRMDRPDTAHPHSFNHNSTGLHDHPSSSLLERVTWQRVCKIWNTRRIRITFKALLSQL